MLRIRVLVIEVVDEEDADEGMTVGECETYGGETLDGAAGLTLTG